jgi:hypothetical protein
MQKALLLPTELVLILQLTELVLILQRQSQRRSDDDAERPVGRVGAIT